MDHETCLKKDAAYVMGTYGRFPVVPASGRGARMTDADGTTYIDFTSGIGVNSLGWCDDGWITAVSEQLHKIQHVSNYYVSEPAVRLAEMLVPAAGMSKIFFGNSGAEANEGAIKTARKYSFDKYGAGRSVIVTLTNSFHGRTVTTLAATGQEHFHQYFFPFTEGFRYVPLNDEAALLEALASNDVCAVMAEPIQGEGGVYPMDASFASLLRRLCDERDLLLIFDEVQTGIGRTGKLFAYQHLGIRPDIVTAAKGLGGGLPIGAFLCAERCASILGPGMHGSTFGGNPVVCAGACEVISRLTTSFLDEVEKKGAYIRDRIRRAAIPGVSDIRGMGLMIGIEVQGSPKFYAKEALHAGLLVLTAGQNVVRLLPPLTITYEEINAGLDILIPVLNQKENHEQ